MERNRIECTNFERKTPTALFAKIAKRVRFVRAHLDVIFSQISINTYRYLDPVLPEFAVGAREATHEILP
jgi:hypothetical protein